MAKNSDQLTKKHVIFVAEYLACNNATKAAIAAGYSKNSAQVIGCQLLRHPKVAAEIAKKTTERLAKLDITADAVLKELALMGFARMSTYIKTQADGSAYVDLASLTPEQSAAIQEITVDEYAEGSGDAARQVKRVRFKLGDKRGSLELLGKNLRLFTDKVEASGPDGSPLVIMTSVPRPERGK